MKTKQQLIKEFVEVNTLLVDQRKKALELAEAFISEHLEEGRDNIDFWFIDPYGYIEEDNIWVVCAFDRAMVRRFINGNYYISKKEAVEERDAQVNETASGK